LWQKRQYFETKQNSTVSLALDWTGKIEKYKDKLENL